MPAEPSTSKTAEVAAAPTKEENAQPTLGVLEEDDEFEEFPVQGPPQHHLFIGLKLTALCVPS